LQSIFIKTSAWYILAFLFAAGHEERNASVSFSMERNEYPAKATTPNFSNLLRIIPQSMSVQKVALITAGSAGLGAQIARVFAPDFRVVCDPSSH
jgi:hypothetical protein